MDQSHIHWRLFFLIIFNVKMIKVLSNPALPIGLTKIEFRLTLFITVMPPTFLSP